MKFEDKPITQYLHYGTLKCGSELSNESLQKFADFINSVKRDLSNRSGGFILNDIEYCNIHIGGNGWSIKSQGKHITKIPEPSKTKLWKMFLWK